MEKRKNRLIISILGFFVFITPIVFFCYSLDREYELEKERVQANLKEKLIDSANKFEENLDCFNYLKSEINSIHQELLPNCPDEIIKQIPDESYTKSLYTPELLDKIVKKTADRFNPIMITLGTQDFKELYGYYLGDIYAK